ncbi:hypothetical protein TorRG33x02_301500, partial [Trema orientale]
QMREIKERRQRLENYLRPMEVDDEAVVAGSVDNETMAAGVEDDKDHAAGAKNDRA